MAKKLRCYLTMHRWQKKRSDDGEIYLECRDCGKMKVPPGAGIYPLG